MFAFVVFDKSFSVLSQQIGCEARLQDNLFGEGWT